MTEEKCRLEVSALKARIDKWGDNLAIQIPQSLASEVGLEADAEVELTAGDGELLITVRKGSKSRLDILLEGVTEENIHAEVDTGQPVGKEVW